MTVERTIRLAAVVDDLASAWAFIMDRLDEVGPEPSVSISPMWSYGEDEDGRLQFEVSVSGMVKETDG